MQHLVHERAFAGAAHAADADEKAERHGDVDVAQVVGRGAEEFELKIRIGRAALFGQRNRFRFAEISAGERILVAAASS